LLKKKRGQGCQKKKEEKGKIERRLDINAWARPSRISFPDRVARKELGIHFAS
jgi:hypothetical protein